MPISLHSLHQPLNDFLLAQFDMGDDAPVAFRFDKFGSILSDADFKDERHPELGYLPALAREKFSELVNRIPLDAGDGLNVILSEGSIDSTYFFRMLAPSQPYVPFGTGESKKEAIFNTFNSLKAEAMKVYDRLTLESMSGLMLDFKPTMATPEDWYESSNNDVWTHHAFEISDGGPDAPAAFPDSGVSDELWKLKPSDVVMETVLQLPPGMASFPTVGEIDLPARALQARAQRFEDIPMLAEGAALRDEAADEMMVHDHFVRQLQDLSIRDRILVKEVIADQAPTQPVKTSSIAISFDCCVVRIRRVWLMDAFINQPSWWIPGIPKGQLTESGRAGNIPLMPIGLVVIRNLSIEADWAAEDVEIASQATELGPFKVGQEVEAGKLSHPGLQTVGWLLQAMPVVPPNDEPFGL